MCTLGLARPPLSWTTLSSLPFLRVGRLQYSRRLPEERARWAAFRPARSSGLPPTARVSFVCCSRQGWTTASHEALMPHGTGAICSRGDPVADRCVERDNGLTPRLERGQPSVLAYPDTTCLREPPP